MNFEGYTNLREIGRGGFGSVYKAVDAAHKREVAIKILDGASAVDDATVIRFQRECKTMGKISNHPHIVNIFNSGIAQDGSLYLVMQYYGHGSLSDKARKRLLTTAEALNVGVQISSALYAAHSENIIHKDLKPDNIFLSEYGDSALGDFGISAFVDTTRTQSIAFTPAFAAPESLEGTGGVAADIYGLGATLYAVLTGAPPFALPSQAAQIHAIINTPAPPINRPDVPPSLANLIARTLAKDPNQRPASAYELAVSLRRIESQLGLAPTPIKLKESELVDKSTQLAVTNPTPPIPSPQPPVDQPNPNPSFDHPRLEPPKLEEPSPPPDPGVADRRPRRRRQEIQVDPRPRKVVPFDPDDPAPTPPARHKPAGHQPERNDHKPEVETLSEPPANDEPLKSLNPILVAVGVVLAIGIAVTAFKLGGSPDESTTSDGGRQEETLSPSLTPSPEQPTRVIFDPPADGRVRLSWKHPGGDNIEFQVWASNSEQIIQAGITENEAWFNESEAPAYGECVVIAVVTPDGNLSTSNEPGCRS